MTKRIFFLLFAFLTLITLGYRITHAEKSDYGKAHDFGLKDINDKMFKLSDYSGQIIMLNFFATWCPPCRAEIPDFNAISGEYKGYVKVIAINVGKESLTKVKNFAEALNLEFTVALDDGVASGLYGPMPGIPVTVIIDKDFNIVRKYVGMRTKDVFIKDIEELMQKQQ